MVNVTRVSVNVGGMDTVRFVAVGQGSAQLAMTGSVSVRSTVPGLTPSLLEVREIRDRSGYQAPAIRP